MANKNETGRMAADRNVYYDPVPRCCPEHGQQLQHRFVGGQTSSAAFQPVMSSSIETLSLWEVAPLVLH